MDLLEDVFDGVDCLDFICGVCCLIGVIVVDGEVGEC